MNSPKEKAPPPEEVGAPAEKSPRKRDFSVPPGGSAGTGMPRGIPPPMGPGFGYGASAGPAPGGAEREPGDTPSAARGIPPRGAAYIGGFHPGG